MACRNVKAQKHRIVSSSTQGVEINWPSYYSVYLHNSSFLSRHVLLPPSPSSPPLQGLAAKTGLGRMLESSQDVLHRSWAVSDQCNPGGVCSVGICIRCSADTVTVDQQT